MVVLRGHLFILVHVVRNIFNGVVLILIVWEKKSTFNFLQLFLTAVVTVFLVPRNPSRSTLITL